MSTIEQLRQSFLQEASELLERLEVNLLELEKQREDEELVHQIFRVMHTLKGSSNMFGMVHASDYAHKLETIYDAVRSGLITIQDDIISHSYQAIDHLRLLLDDADLEDEELRENHKKHLSDLEQFIDSLDLDQTKEDQHTEQDTQASSSPTTYLVSFTEAEEWGEGETYNHLLDECIGFGDHIICRPTEEEELSERWQVVIVASAEEEQELRDLFLFVGEEHSWCVEKLYEGDALAINTFREYVAECAKESTLPPFDELQAVLFQSIAAWEASEDSENQTAAAPHSSSSSPSKAPQHTTIRVDTTKLDTLMGLVSEMVTSQARLSVLLEESGLDQSSEITEVVEGLDKITRSLRENAYAISMVPLTTLETRFKRMIRDLATEMEKEVMLLTGGLDTELDKSMIEKLIDPMMHLFRNAVDHGIETPEERRATGKSAEGTIRIKAYYSGSHVVIEISDDGNGLDLEKIRAKAIEKGLITAADQLSERETAHLIFHPGFSTSDQISEISGRGVGMDVVKTAVNAIRGSVSVESRPGAGTTFQITLPVTLSIIDGLLVTLGQTRYLIPLRFVDKCFELVSAETDDAETGVTVVENEQLPIINLRSVFAIGGQRPEISSLIMMQWGGVRVGLLVDAIVGEYQAVLKSLGKLYENVSMVSGATILGDGDIALVIDPSAIVNRFINTSNKKTEEVTHE